MASAKRIPASGGAKRLTNPNDAHYRTTATSYHDCIHRSSINFFANVELSRQRIVVQRSQRKFEDELLIRPGS